ncbi:SDR family NAD(P)-dependent oxidoreductase, partial [Streptomyces decoyicus]|uniref:SDR family NAD(P)-dependent oxidoreductase n=1 Tax=Streptomyces decoyicus TaxID=249567 RepID=UPI0033B251BA
MTENGKVWLVTGASSGFGRAIAEAAVAAGDTVVGTARRTEALADLVAAHPDRVEAIGLDITDGGRIDVVAADTKPSDSPKPPTPAEPTKPGEPGDEPDCTVD